MKDETVRCFIIADDYKWHILTDDIADFSSKIIPYLSLMTVSNKENNYYMKNIFMLKSEYISTLKRMAANYTPDINIVKTRHKVPHLKLVK